jgi:hypothetical protein
VNCVLQVNFARCVTHEEAALMPARIERSVPFIKLDKVGLDIFSDFIPRKLHDAVIPIIGSFAMFVGLITLDF